MTLRGLKVLRRRSESDVRPISQSATWDFAACTVAGTTALVVCIGMPRLQVAIALVPCILLSSLAAMLILPCWRQFLGAKNGDLYAFALCAVTGLALRAIETWPLQWLAGWCALFALELVLRHLSAAWQDGLLSAASLSISNRTGLIGMRAAGFDPMQMFAEAFLLPTWLCANPDIGAPGSHVVTGPDALAALDYALDTDPASLINRMQVAAAWSCQSDSGSPRLSLPERILITAHRCPGWHVRFKYLIDKLVALLLLVLLAPLMLAIAWAVMATGDGRVLVREPRQDWQNHQFHLLKFCTWTDKACLSRGCLRSTRLGRRLRACSLDGLPQLWNVLRGEMSLVGPRPQTARLDAADPTGCAILAEYAVRHGVRPGVTGWAQIHGRCGALMSRERVRRQIAHDVWYIENWSLWLDFRILAMTPFCLVRERAP